LHRFLTVGHGNLHYDFDFFWIHGDPILIYDVPQQFSLLNSEDAFYWGSDIYHILSTSQKSVSDGAGDLTSSWNKP